MKRFNTYFKRTTLIFLFTIIFILSYSFLNTDESSIFKIDFLIEGYKILNLIDYVQPEEITYRMPFIPIISYILYLLPTFFDKFIFAFIFLLIIINLIIIYFLIENTISIKKYIFLIISLLLVLINHNFSNIEQLIYTVILLLSISTLIIRTRYYLNGKNSYKWDIISGIMISSSLLIRTPLFLLPFMIILYDKITFKKDFSIRKSIVFIISSYIFIIPWTILNYKITHSIVLFEYKRAHSNIISGVLGFIETTEGNIYSLANLSPNSNVILWAISYILKHPSEYVLSFLKRIIFFIKINPIFNILSILSIFIYKKNKEYKILFIFFLYFIVIHCLLSVEKRYFIPIIIISVIMGLMLILKIFLNKENKEKGITLNLQKFISFQAYIVLIFSLFLVLFVILYPLNKKTIIIKDNEKKIDSITYLSLMYDKINNYNGDKALFYMENYLKHTYRKDEIYKKTLTLYNIIKNNIADINITLEKIPLDELIGRAIVLKYLEKDRFDKAIEFIENNRDLFFGYVRESVFQSNTKIRNKLLTQFQTNSWIECASLLPTWENNKAKILRDIYNLLKYYNKEEEFNTIISIFYNSHKNYNYTTECLTIEKQIFSAINLINDNKFNESLNISNNILNTKCYKVYIEKGNAYFNLKDYNKAIENFNIAKEIASSKDTYIGLICSYKKIKDYKKLNEIEMEMTYTIPKNEKNKILNITNQLCN